MLLAGFVFLLLLTGVYAATSEPPGSVGQDPPDRGEEETTNGGMIMIEEGVFDISGWLNRQRGNNRVYAATTETPGSVGQDPPNQDEEEATSGGMFTAGYGGGDWLNQQYGEDDVGLPGLPVYHSRTNIRRVLPDIVHIKHFDFVDDQFVRRPLDEDGDSLSHDDPPEFLKEYYESFKEPPEMESGCSYLGITGDLGLKQHDELTISRPVKHHRTVTLVYLEMGMSAILDVRETDQVFIAHIWVYMSWHNKLISWNPRNYCGMKHLVVPTELLWKPDVIIEEMIEKDKTPPSPFLKIRADGEVEHRNDQVVTGSCQMDVHRFPFDVQRCNITFKSLMHTDDEIRFVVNLNSTVVLKWTRKVMQTQYEWLFVKMTVSNRTTAYFFDANQTAIVYTVHMKRRSVLYAANFLLPIFFFLCMDLASFLIPDGGGEKISFKVTVLLAVTVMQLILNEILPCSSDRMPLIAVYCLGVFSLMLVSLMETILARYLIEKDLETDRNASLNGNKQGDVSVNGFLSDFRSCSDNNSTDKTAFETKQMLAVEVEEAQVKPGHWTRLANKINRGFFVLYLTTVVVFFAYIVALWTSYEEDQQ